MISSFLDPIGYFISPPGAPAYYEIFNRSVGLIIIWVLTALVIQRKYTEEAMGRANMELEYKVEEGTRNLTESEAKFRGLFDNIQQSVTLHR